VRQDTTTDATNIRFMDFTPLSGNRDPNIHAATPGHGRPHSRWLVVLWFAMIVSGATTTSLLRAGNVNAVLVKVSLTGHEIAGAAIAALAVSYITFRRAVLPLWSSAAIIAVLACGWMASRTFTPSWAAAHGIIAAFAAAAIVKRTRVRRSTTPAWQRASAQLALVAVLIQVGAGALVRHQLLTLPWHLLLGGIAALLILVAAVPTAQDPDSPAAARRVAKSAITTLVAQVCLGAAIFVFILIGAESAGVWIGLTTAHVVMGSVILAVTWALATVHRTASTDAACARGSGRS
jgi:hypothetical protein